MSLTEDEPVLEDRREALESRWEGTSDYPLEFLSTASIYANTELISLGTALEEMSSSWETKERLLGWIISLTPWL